MLWNQAGKFRESTCILWGKFTLRSCQFTLGPWKKHGWALLFSVQCCIVWGVETNWIVPLIQKKLYVSVPFKMTRLCCGERNMICQDQSFAEWRMERIVDEWNKREEKTWNCVCDHGCQGGVLLEKKKISDKNHSRTLYCAVCHLPVVVQRSIYAKHSLDRNHCECWIVFPKMGKMNSHRRAVLVMIVLHQTRRQRVWIPRCFYQCWELLVPSSTFCCSIPPWDSQFSAPTLFVIWKSCYLTGIAWTVKRSSTQVSSSSWDQNSTCVSWKSDSCLQNSFKGRFFFPAPFLKCFSLSHTRMWFLFWLNRKQKRRCNFSVIDAKALWKKKKSCCQNVWHTCHLRVIRMLDELCVKTRAKKKKKKKFNDQLLFFLTTIF